MRRFSMKGLFAVLTIKRAGRTRVNWDRCVLIASTAVTIGLIALYAFSKAASP